MGGFFVGRVREVGLTTLGQPRLSEGALPYPKPNIKDDRS
jgi:hypothetical protein